MPSQRLRRVRHDEDGSAGDAAGSRHGHRLGLHRRRRRPRRVERRAHAGPRPPARARARLGRAAQPRRPRHARRARPRRARPGRAAGARVEELGRYGIAVRAAEPAQARSVDGGVEIDGERARTAILATGLLDPTPAIEGFDAIYGTSAHTCPYCDGWEHRDQRIAVLAPVPGAGAHLGRLLRQWSGDVVVLTGGRPGVDDEEEAALAAIGVPVERAPIERLASSDGRLTAIELAGRAAARARRALLPRRARAAHRARRGAGLRARRGRLRDRRGRGPPDHRRPRLRRRQLRRPDAERADGDRRRRTGRGRRQRAARRRGRPAAGRAS